MFEKYATSQRIERYPYLHETQYAVITNILCYSCMSRLHATEIQLKYFISYLLMPLQMSSSKRERQRGNPRQLYGLAAI